MNVFSLFTATDPSGGSGDFDPDVNLDVTGGGGSDSFQFFIACFVLALILIALGLLMARQLRRMNRNYREKVEAGEMPSEGVAPGSTGLVAANSSSGSQAAGSHSSDRRAAGGHRDGAAGASAGGPGDVSTPGDDEHREGPAEQDDGWS